MDQQWRGGAAPARSTPRGTDLKYKHAPFRPSPTAGKPMKPNHNTVPSSGAHAPGGRQPGTRMAPGAVSAQRGSHFQQRHQFEQTMAKVTAQMDDALMSEAARCQQLEDELRLLREDMCVSHVPLSHTFPHIKPMDPDSGGTQVPGEGFE